MSTYEPGNAEEQEIKTFIKSVGQWVWAPVASFLFLSLLCRIANEFPSINEKMPDPMPGFIEQMLKPNGWTLLLISVLLVSFVRRVTPPKTPVRKLVVGGHSLDLFRVFLACFFFLYTFIVAKGMAPLPDQAPRMDFQGIFCIVTGMVIAWQCLVSQYRLFLVGSWLFILWVGLPQMAERLKFLQMMLEPTSVVLISQYGLGLMLILMMTPRALQTYSRKSEEYKPAQPLLFRKGLPF